MVTWSLHWARLLSGCGSQCRTGVTGPEGATSPGPSSFLFLPDHRAPDEVPPRESLLIVLGVFF